ncbi:MAG: hypothetical protein WCE66_05570 [Azonexus sp.]
MLEPSFLVLLGGLVAIIVLLMVVLLRGSRRGEEEVRLRALQEAQEKGLERL